MKAVILAGGLGTRLGHLTNNKPKPMIKIGNIPLLEHQILLLKKYGIKDIIIITGYLSKIIENRFKDGRNFGIKIDYFVEKKPLGTSGGIKEIQNKLRKDFILLYGDVMLDINIKKLIDFHRKKKAFCTLVIHPNDHPHDSDLIETDSNQRIIRFHSKPHNINKYYKNLVNAGIYILSPRIFEYIRSGVKADFGKDIFPKILRKESIFGYNTPEYIKDMGTLDRLKKVRNDYKTDKIKRLNIENKRKAIFLDRDGVLNKEINLLHRIEDFELLPNVGKAIKKINNSEFLTIVITNQSVVARNLCTLEQLEEIHKKMETLLGKENAKLDGIYFCPHHPDKGYSEENPKYKIKCNCRKPEIGMIKKAENEFNIDIRNSFIVGDSTKDILCGKKAGLKTIFIGKKENLKDTDLKPHYFFPNLFETVNFIIKQHNKTFKPD